MKRIPWLFGIYCLLLVWIILFKLSVSLEDLQALAGNRSINLIPFHYEDDMRFARFHWTEVLENILIFIPFGVYLKLLNLPGKQAVLIGFLTSLALEAGQYLGALGSFDITDLLTNTLGTALGVLAYFLSMKLLRSQARANKVLGTLALLGTAALLALFALLTAAN
ncbi:MAG: VanZ family protein [Ruminiclostridium sp.]|nr:VanZ family protein [Ruminiclostridium sp.]